MRQNIASRALFLLAIVGCFAASPVAAFQDLPDAKTLVELHLKSLGDRSALESIKTMETTATMTMPGGPAGDMSASMVILQKDGKSVSTITIEQLGEMKQGSDGEVFWSNNPFTGPTLMKKSDLGAQAEEMGSPVPALKWMDKLDKIKVVALEDVDGVSCIKAVFDDNGAKTTRFFNAKDGTITKLIASNKSPMGEMEVEIIPSNYKVVSGVNLPHKQVTVMDQGEVVLEISEIKINQEIPDEKFELPEEIKKLVAKEKGDK